MLSFWLKICGCHGWSSPSLFKYSQIHEHTFHDLNCLFGESGGISHFWTSPFCSTVAHLACHQALLRFPCIKTKKTEASMTSISLSNLSYNGCKWCRYPIIPIGPIHVTLRFWQFALALWLHQRPKTCSFRPGQWLWLQPTEERIRMEMTPATSQSNDCSI